MRRIHDIGVFSAVREAGLLKLLPSIPRMIVGVGTCGCGNGAEEIFHALQDGIDRSGLEVVLAGVGCFGSCFQEPLVGIRFPAAPLVLLRHVQAHDAGRILEALASKVMPPDLIYCKIEDWDHITSTLRYGTGYPEIPLWSELARSNRWGPIRAGCA